MDSEKRNQNSIPTKRGKIPHPLRTTTHTNLLKSLPLGLQPSGNSELRHRIMPQQMKQQQQNKCVRKLFITKVQPSMTRLVASQFSRYQATLFISLADPGTGSHLIQATWTTRRTIIHTTSRPRPGTKTHTHH